MSDVSALQVQCRKMVADPDDFKAGHYMFASGVATFPPLGSEPNPQTPFRHNIVFDIALSRQPEDDAVVHVAPAWFGASGSADFIHYNFKEPTVSVVGNNVRVNVAVEIGGRFPWLQAVSFFCVARARR
ncbi:hypothetical protein [Mesorhizobium sp. Z1-4]|uniref:hypothetical protein n=1 Tax=Mesorhizobium sp. Z1-4 TaxID=2448478 RepID=UPI000FD79744|nr:hypothetical protein [Mesorhizobium sp. Z1-4]